MAQTEQEHHKNLTLELDKMKFETQIHDLLADLSFLLCEMEIKIISTS